MKHKEWQKVNIQTEGLHESTLALRLTMLTKNTNNTKLCKALRQHLISFLSSEAWFVCLFQFKIIWFFNSGPCFWKNKTAKKLVKMFCYCRATCCTRFQVSCLGREWALVKAVTKLSCHLLVSMQQFQFIFTNSLGNGDLFNANFANTTFQKASFLT